MKRLVVGGFERVYEINRNFRNEGISTHHNPEFTMLEFYQAYTDYHGMMDLSEELLRQAAIDATGSAVVEYQGEKIDFGRFRRVTMREAVGDSSLKGHALVEAFERDVESTLIQPTIVYDIRWKFRRSRRTSRTIRNSWSASRSTSPAWRSATPSPS